MWPVGLLGVIAYWKDGKLDARTGFLIAIGLFFGAYLGARITLSISPATMKRLYAVFLLIIGTYFLLTIKSDPKPSEPPSPLTEPSGQVH